jgi:hypothetical protein
MKLKGGGDAHFAKCPRPDEPDGGGEHDYENTEPQIAVTEKTRK